MSSDVGDAFDEAVRALEGLGHVVSVVDMDGALPAPELIDAIARYAPPPRPQPSEAGPVEPTRDEVTGFVFKVQANMDPQHRDRIAFMRMVSGTFRRGMKLTPSGLGKPIAVHSPILFFAQDRELADTAEAGDIIGIPNHGTLRVGDTLSERNDEPALETAAR